MKKALWLLCCCLPSLARADLLPPGHEELRQRIRNDPQTYDRADQFCDRKIVGSPCVVPGNPFEGGGNGTCQTWPNDGQRTIDSLCTFGERREVIRNIPDRGYMGSDDTCEAARKNPNSLSALDIVRQHLSCDPTPTVPDQFCDGKAVGDACEATMMVGGSISSYPGRCGERQDRARFYSQGYNSKTRTVLLCLPENPVTIEIRPSSPPNWFQRLLE